MNDTKIKHLKFKTGAENRHGAGVGTVEGARWTLSAFKRGLFTQMLKNNNPELPFHLIMTSLTFVFNLSKIIIFVKGHV